MKDDVLETKLCKACDLVKPVNHFHRTGLTSGDGRNARCRVCKRIGLLLPKELKRIPRRGIGVSIFDDIKISHVKDQDFIEMYVWLEKRLGYDLRSEKSIHEQFCERYGLKIRKNYKRFANHKSPKDLGLI